MTNVRKIHVDWYGQQPPRFHGGPQLAYQGDHLSNMVVFDHAPELPNYYLLVEMKTDEAGPVVTLPEILLEGAYWVIPNYYTQICQKITYQVCCKTESGDFEHHSAKFEGTILPVIKHNGEPIDQSPMFDTYMDILGKRVDKLIVAAGDIQIDSELKSDSGNPVQNRVIKAKIDEIDENAIALNGRLAQVTSAIGTTTVHSETVDDNVTQGIVYRKNGGQIEHANALSIKHTVADGETACKFSGYTWSNTNVAALIAFDANMSMLDYYGETVGKYENIEYTYPTGTKTIVVNGITSPALMPLLTVYATTEEITDVGERFERIEETTIDALKTLNIACDGDSTTGEGAQEDRKSWFSYALAQTGYGTRKNVGCGNAFAKDRTSNTSGTTFYPQWKPSVGSAWVDYYGLSDPNYAGSEGTYISGTEEFDQATANNCLYSHIGYYVDGVNNGLWPAPDVFILAMNGTNDLWRDTEQRTLTALGTFEDTITGDWSALTRDNVLKSIRWAVQFIRATYPTCLIFFKTATQKCKETHPYFYIAEEPILKLCKYLSVPVIDSYGELGINAEFEHRPANNNQWTSDGVHPTDAGYKKEGRFVAKMILNNYRPNA